MSTTETSVKKDEDGGLCLFLVVLLVVERVRIAPLFRQSKAWLNTLSKLYIQAPTERTKSALFAQQFGLMLSIVIPIWLCLNQFSIIHFRIFQRREQVWCDGPHQISLTIPAQFVQRKHLDLFIQNKNKHNWEFYPQCHNISIALFAA